MRGKVIVFIILAVVSFFMLIGGGVLFGCAEMLVPFNAVPLGFLLLICGIGGIIAFSMLAGLAHEDFI